jgi:hypothetical protein
MALPSTTLARWVASINARTGRPLKPWRQVAVTDEDPFAPHLRAEVGHLFIDAHSPGDGWTRYRLGEMVNEGGGMSHVATSQAFKRGEFEAFVRGILTGLDLAAVRFDEYGEECARNEETDTGVMWALVEQLAGRAGRGTDEAD